MHKIFQLYCNYILAYWLWFYFFDCRFICPRMVLGSIHQLPRTMDWLAIDIDATQRIFTKVYRALSQEKRIKRDIRMVPTIKHDFVRRGSQRESFRVVEREYLWRIARWNDEPKTRVRSKSYTSRSFVLWDHCRWHCCDGEKLRSAKRDSFCNARRKVQFSISWQACSFAINKTRNSAADVF